ncbi:uncharacterized protein [Prorops nasuta]|uniref:uncharacterized protein n=1 Tax=Prorops nasuta TaxID=863751 RepID=UPI0034CF14FB
MYLSPPEKGDWKKNTEGFWARWNMPNCLGSIDGKHIRIRCPPHSGSLCFNYKKYYSIVLLAIADHLYRFTLVDVGSYGGNSDGGIFNNSDISVHLNNKLNIPHGDINLPGSELKTSLFFIADDAFKLSKRIMKPFSYENLNYEKQIFNYRISRARRTVESAFGILANKWRILHTAICVLPQTADLMVYASICLHNFILKEEEHSGYKDFSNVCSASIEENSIWINTTPNFEEDNTAISGEMQRCILKDYFQSAAGEVEWQHEYVQRGTFRDNKE